MTGACGGGQHAAPADAPGAARGGRHAAPAAAPGAAMCDCPWRSYAWAWGPAGLWLAPPGGCTPAATVGPSSRAVLLLCVGRPAALRRWFWWRGAAWRWCRWEYMQPRWNCGCGTAFCYVGLADADTNGNGHAAWVWGGRFATNRWLMRGCGGAGRACSPQRRDAQISWHVSEACEAHARARSRAHTRI
eukprot:1161026-Pelagomonas_calceolata.AAC.5